MSVRVRIPPFLRQFSGGREVVESIGQNVGECLDNLELQFPGIREQLHDEQGQSSSYLMVYSGLERLAYPAELASPVKDGDELMIVPIIAGG